MEINEKKFCFIMCVNDYSKMEESIRYINRLIIPDGYEIDLLTIEESDSMAEGYEEAKNSTDAKYKIYLHQDTYVINENILCDLIKIFESDSKIGAVGVMGSEDILGNRITKASEVFGIVVSQNWRENSYTDGNAYQERYDNEIEGKYKEVGCLWGCFIATSVDFKWEKLADNDFSYYSVLLSLEMIKNGYKIVVPNQKYNIWCIHEGNNEGLCFKKELIESIEKKYPKQFDSKMKKRVLILNSEIRYWSMQVSLIMMGYMAEEYNERTSMLNMNYEIAERLYEWLCLNDYLFVFTYNFSPIVAEASEKAGIKYISWAWDSPTLSYVFPQAKNKNVWAFVFDKEEKEDLIKFGLPHVNHMPLGADKNVSGSLVISKEDEKNYSHDVSFIGQMYYSDILREHVKEYSESSKKKINDLLANELGNWNDPKKMFDYIEDDMKEVFFSKAGKKGLEYYDENNFTVMFFRNIAHAERVFIFNKLAEQFRLDIYTKGDTSELENVNIHGPVHNLLVAPKIFHLSKINLNITTRNIRSGIPLRVYEIMSVGGFVISNYQPEMDELFVPDKEIVYFKSIDELLEKTKYYLTHENQRQRIAINGYQRVKKDYLYDNAIRKMIQISGIE